MSPLLSVYRDRDIGAHDSAGCTADAFLLVGAMRRVIPLIGDYFLVEFHYFFRAHGRAQAASLAEKLVYFDSCHTLPLVSKAF
jgi:hypothetical protein